MPARRTTALALLALILSTGITAAKRLPPPPSLPAIAGEIEQAASEIVRLDAARQQAAEALRVAATDVDRKAAETTLRATERLLELKRQKLNEALRRSLEAVVAQLAAVNKPAPRCDPSDPLCGL